MQLLRIVFAFLYTGKKIAREFKAYGFTYVGTFLTLMKVALV